MGRYLTLLAEQQRQGGHSSEHGPIKQETALVPIAVRVWACVFMSLLCMDMRFQLVDVDRSVIRLVDVGAFISLPYV